MRVILKQRVDKLGQTGDVINVKIPQLIASIALLS